MRGLDQQRLELGAAQLVAAGRQRPERVAVIALAPGDHLRPLRLACLDEILPRHLQRRFHGLRAAADEIDVRDAFWRIRHQRISEPFGDLGGEEAGVGVGQLIDLLMQRRVDVRMAVAEA
jgi:hypothetical protein